MDLQIQNAAVWQHREPTKMNRESSWRCGGMNEVFVQQNKIGALIVRIGLWGPLYYEYNKDPQNRIGNY